MVIRGGQRLRTRQILRNVWVPEINSRAGQISGRLDVNQGLLQENLEPRDGGFTIENETSVHRVKQRYRERLILEKGVNALVLKSRTPEMVPQPGGWNPKSTSHRPQVPYRAPAWSRYGP